MANGSGVCAVYFAGSASFTRDPSLHLLTAMLNPGVKHEDVERKLTAEIERIKQTGVSAEEVKTAIAGQDPNWGRIMMALGKSPARVEQQRVAIAFDDELLVEQGMLREGARIGRIREIMGRPEYAITVDLGLGRSEDRVWTCDLSEEYVRINAKYTT